MKIIRKTQISKEKELDPTREKWCGGKHYHRLVVTIYDDEIILDKKLWFLYGHNDSEGLDRIWTRTECDVSYKTQNIENITPELEKRMIKHIIDNLEKSIKTSKSNIKKIENKIKEDENTRKELLKSEFFREEKLNRIVNED